MRRVVAVVILRGAFVRVRYCVSLLAVDMRCIRGNVRACGGVNKDVAIE